MATLTVGSNFTISWDIPIGHANVVESSLRLTLQNTTGLVNTYFSSTNGTTAGTFTIVQPVTENILGLNIVSSTGKITSPSITVSSAGKYTFVLESLSTTDSNKSVYTVLGKYNVTVISSDTALVAGNIA
jgi:hypothetical protein